MVYRVRWNVLQRDRFVRRWLRFREKYGLTQEQLAEGMGISLRAVKYVEAGRFVPSNDTVMRFAEVEKRFKAGEEMEKRLVWTPTRGDDEI